MAITGIIILILIIISISVYHKKHSTQAQTPVEIIATSIAEKVANVFSSTPNTLAIVCSKYYADQLYVGKTLKLDSSLKVMFTKLLFGFPDAPLMVKSFQYFDIDGNPFEQVTFDKIGAKNYIMLHDEFEQTNYFLNRVMSHGIGIADSSPMIDQDEIELEEHGQKYLYKDYSGLIAVKVIDCIGVTRDRLIRVYTRELTPEDNEFLVTIMDKPDVVDYYIGFQISIHQLEDL